MAGLSPVLPPHRDGDGRLDYTVFMESESEAELSLSLARIKTRSYGSTASVTAPWAERYIEHQLNPSDTLQGIALKYGVTYAVRSLRYPVEYYHYTKHLEPGGLLALVHMEQIKRANKLFSTDCIFLRKSLNIPVISEKASLFNGLGFLDSPENECIDNCTSEAEEPVVVPIGNGSPETNRPMVRPDEELSAKDFLHRLDLQIKRSTQAAKRLKEDDGIRCEDEDSYATSSYQHH